MADKHRVMPLRKVSSEGRLVMIPQDMIDAAARGDRRAIVDIGGDDNNWMPPGATPEIGIFPLQDDRRFDYPVNYNTRFNPKSGEGITFGQLRQLADVYDLLRVIIERRKDQIEAYEWEIMPIKGKESKAPDAVIEAATDFLLHPSTEYSWGEWLRAALEDLLVLDAVAISPRFTYDDKMFSLDLVDPATIKRVIDGRGMTPIPPDPAYQQVIKGIPVVNFTSEELYYWMRNPRTHRVYGFSPVEWIIVTVNIALQRQAFTLSYFSEGNIPEALASVPEGWTTAQIKEFQQYWDALMLGNMANRRRLRWIPTDASKIKELKQPDHKNEFEEWLARLVCFAFSISPSALIKDMNRATADTNKEIAQKEGLMPTLKYLRAKFNFLLQRRMGLPVQFEWKMEEALDSVQQATVHKTYIDAKVITPDEAREDLGRAAMTPAEREAAFPQPLMLDASGIDQNSNNKPGGNKQPPNNPPVDPAEKFVFAPVINIPEREVNVTVGDVNVTAEVPAAA